MSLEYKGKQYVPDPALGSSLGPLTSRQREKLKESLLAEGQESRIYCRPSGKSKMVYVIDGWHRLGLLLELEETPTFRMYDKSISEDEVRNIAERIQAGRRQTGDDWRLQIGREYNATKKKVGRPKTPETAEKPKLCHDDTIYDSAVSVAEKHGVSVRQVKRDAKRAAAYDKLTDSAKKAATSKKLSDDQVVALSKKDANQQNVIARELRVGDAAKAKAALSKPSRNGAPKKPKPKEVSSAKLVDQLTRKFVSPMVRGIDNIATANGGKGRYHKQANDALNSLIGALKQMRSGKQ